MAPSSLLFSSTMIAGTLITLSSSNWLYLWMGMELNLLSFIPLMSSSSNLQETEASVKYFITQAIGSGLMLTAGVMSINPIVFNKMEYIIMIMFISSMMIKLGMTPYHQWLPHVMSCIPWKMCIILATWQKIGPMVMLMMIMPNNMSSLIMLLAVSSAMVGGLGGMNQSQLRSLLAYSSIGHMGWMLMTTQCSTNIFVTYFTVYIIITCSIMGLLMKSNMMKSKINSLMINNTSMFIMMMLIMFSLGGLPPLLGFFPKWMIINSLSIQNMMLTAMMLITGSLMNLFYYFNMAFNFMLTTPQQPTITGNKWYNIVVTTMATCSPLVLFF
uniref:NADH-ubiquinone oxidoreductase chain 2 n=1 Tax=Nectoneanthes multignatha TaxID=3070695 RepID=A0AA50F4B7_9ANNE|nr:NADH dehydrogenase subunit 2 [Nectoneanthes multignatha]WLW41627.1 NADH dehydrogenase subunit 2 [Nectoneanthes multignatha]